MNRYTAVFLSLLAVTPWASAELVTYPAGKDVTTIDDYAVRVRQADGPWQPVDVYPVKVQRVNPTAESARNTVETASMAYFDFDGAPVDVEIVPQRGDAPEAVRVRPLSYGIAHSLSGDTVRLTLVRPCNLSVEVNGDIFHNLHLFANPVDANRPSAKVLRNLKKHRSLMYFGPGVHRLAGDTLRVPSGTTVYVDGGARVVGTLIADSVSDVNFFGRGEVHPQGRGEGVYVRNSRRVKADGIIVTQIPVGGSDSVSVTNVKSISSYGWGDGMNVFASDNVSYDGVFCRNSDDCTTVYATRKGFSGGCRNITMRNSTLWADVAHPVMIGLHGNAEGCDTIQNLLYQNLDILDHQERQIDYQGCMAISCGDNNLVRDVTFDNIRVEDFRRGQLVNIRIFFNKKYCAAPGLAIENVLFKDVTYNGSNAEMSVICGYDAGHRVSGVTFENLTINGLRISDDMPGKPKWYKTGDFARFYIGEHVDGVVFK